MKIKQLKNMLAVCLVAFGLVVVMFTAPAFAADSVAEGEVIVEPSGNTQKTAFEFLCPGSKEQTTTSNVSFACLTRTVLQFLSIAVGIAAVGGITAGGIMYATSGGNPSKTEQGTKIITNSIIGLVLYFLAFAFINFLLPGEVIKQ